MKKIVRDQRGFIFIFLAIGVMLLLCAFAGLALDVGRAYVVKSQLQNAADASALAGAGGLIDTTTKPASVTWGKADTEAKNFIGKNSADGKVLTDCQVETGYWSTTGPPTQTLQPKTIVPTATDVPAVKVTVNKTAGENGGPLQTFFTKVVGWNSFEPSATAVAFRGFPASGPPGTTFPYAISECLESDFMNGTGIFAGGANPSITLTNTVSTSRGDVLAGQWTNLLPPNTNTSSDTAKGYIEYLINPADNHASPSPGVATGDIIDIASGIRDSIYKTTADLIDANGGLVYLPVVACNVAAGAPGGMEILGFAEMQLTASDDPKKTIIGHFVNFYQAPPGASPGGIPSNTIVPPKMAF